MILEKPTKTNYANTLPKVEAKKDIVFFQPIFQTDKETGEKWVSDIKILYKEFIDLLMGFGFRRYDVNKDSIYIHVINNVIAEVTCKQIQDYFINWLIKQPEYFTKDVPTKVIIDKIYKNPSHYFNDNRLSLMMDSTIINFVKDTKDMAIFYYKNGFVEVTKRGLELKNYNLLKGFVWKNQIINRDFVQLPETDVLIGKQQPVFKQFLLNTCKLSAINEQQQALRLKSLLSLIGYNLHMFFDGKLRATIFTDSTISDNPEGRTGKTLIGKAISKIRNIAELNGKIFDTTNRYKYQQVNLDTQIIILNDVLRGFNFESLFNDITEKITVEKKNQQPFEIQSKILISTNEVIKTSGGSAKDRCFEFELSDYYSFEKSPDKEFGHWFFTDWDTEEWSRFDCFMLLCVAEYFRYGASEPEAVNLNARKLLHETCREFLDFMEYKNYEKGVRYRKDDLHNDLMHMYPDFKEHRVFRQQRNTTKWLRSWVKYTEDYNEVEEFRTNGVMFITLK